MNRFVRHREAQPQRPLDDDATVAEVLIVEDLRALAFLEGAVDANDSVDVLLAQLVALVAERLAHLLEQLDAVDELDLASAVLRLPVGDDPDVRGDAGVVEELV